MSKLANSIPAPLRTTLTFVVAAVALAITFAFAAPPISQAATSAQPAGQNTAIRDCNISITRYQNYHQVRMDVNEGHGWKFFLINIDGISNESRQWTSFQTDDGIAFHMPYGYDNAGERHRYFVSVSSWRQLQSQPICESHGEFYVKGNLANKTQMIHPESEAPAGQNGDSAEPVPPANGSDNGGQTDVPNPAVQPTPVFAPTIPRPRPPDDAAILRECDVNITHYQEYYQARMDINEGHGWMYFWITIDGISNENRQWGAFRTDDGLGLYMLYDETNAGEEHEYFVRISPWHKFQPHICETRGTFHVKGSPPREAELMQNDNPDGENPAQPDSATGGDAQNGNQDSADDTKTVQANAPVPTEPLPPTLLPTTRATPQPTPPADAAILHQCDIAITRYTESYKIRMDIKEGVGGRMYWPTIDGITNENRQWRAFQTADGIAFMMDYDDSNAGEQHEYLVTVSPWYQPAFCEARATFYVRP